MIQSTTDYNKFKFRNDNREGGVNESHVQKLVQSIKQKNLLHMRPIEVNSDWEIIDGQHRTMAAQRLGVPIYYEVKSELVADDIITLNITKSWLTKDFFNFYLKNGYKEYQKLDAFIKKHGIKLEVALIIFFDKSENRMSEFKLGKFVMDEQIKDEVIDYCWETIGKIRAYTFKSKWVEAKKFWKALIQMFVHPEFNIETWRKNRDLKIDYFTARASYDDYLRMLENIYNYKVPADKKIHLTTATRDLQSNDY